MIRAVSTGARRTLLRCGAQRRCLSSRVLELLLRESAKQNKGKKQQKQKFPAEPESSLARISERVDAAMGAMEAQRRLLQEISGTVDATELDSAFQRYEELRRVSEYVLQTAYHMLQTLRHLSYALGHDLGCSEC